MLLGGHDRTSTVVFRHICDLPTMRQRAEILVFKFCLRLHRLPSNCLISLLSPLVPNHRLARLRINKLYVANPPHTSPKVKQIILALRQEELQRAREKQVLLHGCRPIIGVDPILTVPATRKERSRLIRWRMDWLPGNPHKCICDTDRASRRHPSLYLFPLDIATLVFLFCFSLTVSSSSSYGTHAYTSINFVRIF